MGGFAAFRIRKLYDDMFESMVLFACWFGMLDETFGMLDVRLLGHKGFFCVQKISTMSTKAWFPLNGKRHDNDTKTKRL